MKPLRLLSSVFALHLAEGYLVSPPGTPAPGAAADCSAWVQNSYSLTCDIVERFFGMSLAQFEAWNPSVTELGEGCNMIEGLYYCVEVDFVTLTTLTTPTTTSTSTTTTGNGVTTPTPTQAGMASSCNKFYLVSSGDTCSNIATAQGISLTNFYAWNPAVGNTCASLWASYYVCVGVISGSSSTPTTLPTTTQTSEVTTPTPTQDGMISNCNKFYLVGSGDTCSNIATAQGISLTNFYAWNPAVGNTCASLWAGYYVCVGITGSATTTPPPTTTQGGNGVVTPTPTQAGMATNCDGFHLVVSGDICSSIAAAAGISLANFYAWNSAVGNTCASLWAGYYVCISLL
ncbi:hypothetical protein QBC33DRAFT_542494 [Phialemonium atrogriseum]|uniref:LysM domain-containing protein n=1 Tax=Phialemonium atrogriseum TaxID=1093897 RepID=A0AAJ0BXI2_9PEZI|nr:uncharacterized protein QBC33DRAFT_542494 [Phialemonium atrogriseum]KAK1766314.1 hypothetical protein QBC33DRAFT_542494 [Phialemonium atrogriseum]